MVKRWDEHTREQGSNICKNRVLQLNMQKSIEVKKKKHLLIFSVSLMNFYSNGKFRCFSANQTREAIVQVGCQVISIGILGSDTGSCYPMLHLQFK